MGCEGCGLKVEFKYTDPDAGIPTNKNAVITKASPGLGENLIYKINDDVVANFGEPHIDLSGPNASKDGECDWVAGDCKEVDACEVFLIIPMASMRDDMELYFSEFNMYVGSATNNLIPPNSILADQMPHDLILKWEDNGNAECRTDKYAEWIFSLIGEDLVHVADFVVKIRCVDCVVI